MSTKKDYFALSDFEESKYSQYILDVSNTVLGNYGNERICFMQLLGNYSSSTPIVKYTEYTGRLLIYAFHVDIVNYYNMYKSQLKLFCKTQKVFSFCQEAYVFVVDFASSSLQSFKRQKCRIFHFILNRFKGKLL